MARYRILQSPCPSGPVKCFYDVQVRLRWLEAWWTLDSFCDLEDAEEYFDNLIKPLSVAKEKVIKEVVL